MNTARLSFYRFCYYCYCCYYNHNYNYNAVVVAIAIIVNGLLAGTTAVYIIVEPNLQNDQ